MRFSPLNLPKWLLLVVVFGVFVGQLHQLICQAGTHEDEASVAISEIISTDNGLGGDADDMGSCGFQCPFHCSVQAVFATCSLPAFVLCGERLRAEPEDFATSRAGSIDLPPQIA